MRVHALFGAATDESALLGADAVRRRGIRIAKRHQPRDGLLPRDGLDVGIRDVEKIAIEIFHMP